MIALAITIAIPSFATIKTFANTKNTSVESVEAELEYLGEEETKIIEINHETNILKLPQEKVVSQEKVFSNISTEKDIKDSFTMSGSVGVNKNIKSNSYFYLNDGEHLNIDSLTWDSASQYLQVGFINADTGKQYWSESFTGGSLNNSKLTLNAPAGNYYVAIGTANTNTSTVDVVGKFGFNK